ncbi:MAG: FeoA domain [Bacillales bacterium]|jgi:Fe2+ transport system protein FeoA|nr:FeoA domain [Bacillales bacterium]
MRLVNVKVGSHAKVIEIKTNNTILIQRLLEFGISENCSIKVVKKMAFNGPVILESWGQTFCIRHEDAICILVKELEIDGDWSNWKSEYRKNIFI